MHGDFALHGMQVTSLLCYGGYDAYTVILTNLSSDRCYKVGRLRIASGCNQRPDFAFVLRDVWGAALLAARANPLAAMLGVHKPALVGFDAPPKDVATAGAGSPYKGAVPAAHATHAHNHLMSLWVDSIIAQCRPAITYSAAGTGRWSRCRPHRGLTCASPGQRSGRHPLLCSVLALLLPPLRGRKWIMQVAGLQRGNQNTIRLPLEQCDTVGSNHAPATQQHAADRANDHVDAP